MTHSDGYWINKDTRTFMERGYLQPGQTVEERIREIAEAAKGYVDPKVFEGYLLKGWISLASPIWSNFGTDRGLPISCNGSFIDDTIEDILYKTAEIGTQTKHGAGTSAYLGRIRHRGSPISVGGKADGPVHFSQLLSTTLDIISQGNVRRGSCAIYLDVEHPDIEEFLEIREEGHSIQNLSLGVCITDAWMQSMLDGDKDKKKTWLAILRKRSETGYPYIFWTDAVNKNSPFDEKIVASNLCTEICLPSSVDDSFVCCLSSLNILHYDEWKDTDVVKDLVKFLNAVLDEYLFKAKKIKFLENTVRFTEKYRAIGIGTLGWHSYLQSKSIPFEALAAFKLNSEIHSKVWDDASQEGNSWLNYTVTAIAPTTSSSFILGQVSPSIEPLNSNYFVKDLAKGKFTYKNPYLKKLLEAKGEDTVETWDSILLNGGSVQHLSVLTDEEKDVYKTFGEISQANILLQASDRQKYLDQSQSLNLMVHPKASVKDIYELHVTAWKLGLKTLYYQRSTNPAQEYARELLNCAACEV